MKILLASTRQKKEPSSICNQTSAATLGSATSVSKSSSFAYARGNPRSGDSNYDASDTSTTNDSVGVQILWRPGVDNDHPWSNHDFETLGALGKGRFGQVVKARINGTSRFVALKLLGVKKDANDREQSLERIGREIDIHSSIRHSHIIDFMGCYNEPERNVLVLDFAAIGDLYQYINNQPDGLLTLKQAKSFLAQITSALAYLESILVAHRDVKPENILVTGPDTVKLTDFGLSFRWASKGNSRIRRTLCGTPEYIPPEVAILPFQRDSYDARFVDRWSLGILAHELYDGVTPFYMCRSKKRRIANEGGFEHLYEVTLWEVSTFRKFCGFEGNLEQECHGLTDFVGALLKYKPSKRMSAREGMQHVFLRQSPAETQAGDKRSSIETNNQQASSGKRMRPDDAILHIAADV